MDGLETHKVVGSLVSKIVTGGSNNIHLVLFAVFANFGFVRI